MSRVGIDGMTAVVGQPTPAPGAVTVYIQNVNGAWVPTVTLASNDPNAGNFGWKPHVLGDWIGVGAPTTVSGGFPNAGAVYLFHRSGGVWPTTPTQTIYSPVLANNARCGNSFALGQDLLVITCPSALGGAGEAVVYQLVGGTWTALTGPSFTLTGSGVAGANFGESAGISEPRTGSASLILSEPCISCSPTQPGKAYVYSWTGSAFSQAAILQPQPSEQANGDIFSHAGLAIREPDGIAIVAGPNSLVGGVETGAAFVFNRTGGVWSETQRVVGSDSQALDQFGTSCSLGTAQTFSVGAPGHAGSAGPGQGSAYVFGQPDGGGQWVQQSEVTAPDALAGAQFGYRTSMSGTTVLIENQTDAGADAQAAYFYAPLVLPGTNVPVGGPPVTTGGPNATVTFANVQSPGETTMTVDPACPDLAAGAFGAGPTTCVNATTQASFDGGVNVCIPLVNTPTTAVSVFGCDPNPSVVTCPAPGMDARLSGAYTGLDGLALCCGYLTSTLTTPVGANPACFTTTGLTTFRVSSSAPSVPALGPWPWASSCALAALLVMVAIAGHRVRDDRRARHGAVRPGRL